MEVPDLVVAELHLRAIDREVGARIEPRRPTAMRCLVTHSQQGLTRKLCSRRTRDAPPDNQKSILVVRVRR